MGRIPQRVLLLLWLALAASAANPDNGMQAYKDANYKIALPLLQAAATKNPKDPILPAALLSALVYEGHVDEASDAAEAGAAAFPNSPEMMAARGEFAFYMGNMPEADRLFKAAVTLKEATPRAVYGLYRICDLESMYRTARLLCVRAHTLDPDDALITSKFIEYLVPQKRDEILGAFISAHPWLYNNIEKRQATHSEFERELNGRKVFELVGDRAQATLHLVPMMYSGKYERGVGPQLRLNEGRGMALLFDTGASGIILTQRELDNAGLKHVGSFEVRGIGDRGALNSFASVADTCDIGSIKFKNCIIEATEGKSRVAGEEDGLIGADVFDDYIIHIDFQRHELRLTPQPARDATPQGYDRAPSPEEKGFTRVFRSGGHLFVTTTLNNGKPGLFLMDTGASLPAVDPTFARLSTKMHGDVFLPIKGVSGEVNKVFEIDRGVLQFAGFRAAHKGLRAFDLNNAPGHQEFRTSGILGIPMLSMFRLTIDYRNGLVNFDRVSQ